MAHEHVEDFNQPWCKAILESSELESLDDMVLTRQNPPSKQNGTTANSFIAESLATPSTIRAWLTFRKPAPSPFDAEVLFMISIGSGTDGHPGIMHGGMLGSILDEVQGTTCGNYMPKGLMTGEMTVRYKNYISTPCLLLARAHLVREEGRKLWTKGTLEDGKGKIYAESDGLFIKLKSKF